MTGFLLLTHIAYAGQAASTNDIHFSFISPPIVPARDLPKEARCAGITPDPNAKKGKGAGIAFGIVRDPGEQGSLSSVVAGHIAAIAVTWTDENRFKTHQQAENIVRKLLSAPAGADRSGSYCTTFTYVAWSQLLGRPDIAARVEHTDGQPGQLLLFASGDAYLFAYRDRKAKWWFGVWRGAVPK